MTHPIPSFGAARNRWHMTREGDVLVLTRQRPARFDFVVETRVPLMGRARLAHQVRQDVWRGLQRVKGFSPVVEVRREGDDMRLRAGGRLLQGAPTQKMVDIVTNVLNCRHNRARWLNHARFRDSSLNEAAR